MSTKTDIGPRTSNLDAFQHRHIGPDADAQDAMLRAIGVPSLDALIEQTIPSGIRFSRPLNLPPAETRIHQDSRFIRLDVSAISR